MALTQNEADFVQGVSQNTGIDPRVLIAWIQSEGHPGDLYNNYLNITSTTARSLGVRTAGVAAAGTAEFGDVQTGIDATTKEIRSLGLANLAHLTPQQAIGRIAASPWASSHYGGPGGPNLQATFASIFGGAAGLSSPYQGPGTVPLADVGAGGSTAVGGDLGTAASGIGGAVSSAAGYAPFKGVGQDISSAVTSVPKFLKFVSSWRFAEILGGFLLLIVGLLLLGRQFGLSTPGLPGGFDRSLDRAFSEGVRSGEVQQARAAGRASVTRTSTESAASVRARRIRTQAASYDDEIPF